MSDKKATLIKHVKSSNIDAEPSQTEEAATNQTQPKIEKKRIVVKKKVVRVKPQQKTNATIGSTSESSNVPLTKKIQDKNAKKSSTDGKKKIIKKVQSNNGSFSPLHAGPRIIKSTNLPPVPNQGKTAKDHAEWQTQNPVGTAPAKPVSGAPRVAGTVGGKPVAGTRRPRTNNNNRNNNGNRNFTPRNGNDSNNNSRFNNNRNNNSFNRDRDNNDGNNRGFNRNNNNPRFNNNNSNGGNNRFNNNNNRNNNRGGFNKGPNAAPQQPSPTDFNKTKTKKPNFRKKNSSYQKRDANQEKEFIIQKKRDQAAAKLASVPKTIDIMESITVADLAKKMNLKANDIIAKLLTMGMLVTINQQIDHDTAEIIAEEYNCTVNLVSLYDETLIESEEDTEEDLEERAPIVTIMGHVDHGKTKLLDAIRSTNVVGGEFGGITQHIGAYKVSLEERGDIVFLDTPGHAAFTMMRSRGAQITDIVILVVAANDGVMPQTREAIDHAKAAKVPIIVAINKCDLPEANPDRVMQQLSDLGLMPEEWGGQTLYCKISALKKEGIEELLDTILLQSEMLELQANPNCRAEGKVIESRIDQGRGTVASVLIERGTLRQGDYYVAGIYPGRVRAMFDDTGKKIKEAGPSTPVEIIGLSDIPSAGDPFQVTEDEKQARQVGSKRQELERLGANKSGNKFTLDTLFDKVQEGAIESFNVVIKGDVQGSVEALQSSLEKLSTSEIRLNVIRASAGAIIESDITLASASEALVIGFNVRPTPRALALAEQEKVEIRKYNIIYDVVDDVKDAMEGMLSPIVKEVEIGSVEIRDTFKVPKIGIIAGCYVLSGKVKRNSLVRVIRDNIQISKSLIKLSSLKRFKDDAKEVAAGFECGIGLENFQDIKVGDILEVIEEEKIARKLEDGIKKDESI